MFAARTLSLALGFLITVAGATSARAQNLHLIDSNDKGFALYRLGAPNEADMKHLCELGISEMVVLSGTAEKHEFKYAKACPTLKVIFNEKQGSKRPVTAEFLAMFDGWVQDAQLTGKKIAFRCTCGCHRTGRLAAYYQIKYQGITWRDAYAILKNWAKFMIFHADLKPQVQALNDYIHGQPCSTAPRYCVMTKPQQEAFDYSDLQDEE